MTRAPLPTVVRSLRRNASPAGRRAPWVGAGGGRGQAAAGPSGSVAAGLAPNEASAPLCDSQRVLQVVDDVAADGVEHGISGALARRRQPGDGQPDLSGGLG